MRYLVYILFLGLILFGVGCYSSEPAVSESATSQANEANEQTQTSEVSKRISLNINEAVYFEFEKIELIGSLSLLRIAPGMSSVNLWIS